MVVEFHLVWTVATSVPGQHRSVLSSWVTSKTVFHCSWCIHETTTTGLVQFQVLHYRLPARRPRFDPWLFLCWAFARLCGFSMVFLPHSKSSVQVRQRGDSKLPAGMNVSVSGCLPICVQPAVDWRPARCPATRPVHVGKGCSPRCARRGLGGQGKISIYSVLI